MYPEKLVLITLLVRLGVAAAVSAALARSSVFKELLFRECRTPAQTLGLLLFICIPLTLGVWVRVVVPNFLAADIAFETVILCALLLGLWPGLVGAAVLSLPAMLHHEYLSLPFDLAVAFVVGTYRGFVTEEDVWSFSPFIDLSLYRWVRRALKSPRMDRQILLLCLIGLLQLCRTVLAREYPRLLFNVEGNRWFIKLAVFATVAMVVGIPLKIWNALRVERKLEEQTKVLLEARMDALQRQIQPHFLFNTLSSIATLTRVDPERARDMIVKLANILRTVLKDREAFVPLREELALTDDYLDIETARFGQKLRVAKEIEADTLDLLVPSMLLQPLIENSIKHGLEPRISGGTVTLRSRVQDGRLLVEVEDDGVGVSDDLDSAPKRGTGIGMRNVRERLHVLYGGAERFDMVSRPGRGTRISIEMPCLEVGEASITSQAAMMRS